MNILVVDDEPINVLLLESLLKDKYAITTASNGMLAYEKMEEQTPDIVLLDFLMPVLNGFETLKKIRENKRFANVAVIMVTARVEREDVKEALLLGADDYIKKPVDATELFTKIEIHSKLNQKSKKLLEYQVYADIHDSMITAQRIQQTLLPDNKHFTNVFPNSFALYIPRDMVGGDFYFVHENAEHEKFICVSDSTGHGVPAAMLSTITYMSLDYFVRKQGINNPADVAVGLIDELFFNLNQSEDTYVSSHDLDAVFCKLDCEQKILSFVGIRRPLVIVREGVDHLTVNGKEIRYNLNKNNYYLFYIRGEFATSGERLVKEDLNIYDIELQTDDTIYMYSDGVTDQFGGEKDKKFSKRRFLDLILDSQGSTLKIQKLKMYQEIERWSGDMEQTDDIVIVGVKV